MKRWRGGWFLRDPPIPVGNLTSSHDDPRAREEGPELVTSLTALDGPGSEQEGPIWGYATPVEGESAYYAVDVEEAAARLQESPDRVREMLVTGELEGIPPGATAQGDWKVLLPATPDLEDSAPVDEPSASPAVVQEEATPPAKSPEQPVGSPEAVAEGPQAATEESARGDGAEVAPEPTAASGWVSTQQAARALGISPRTVRWHIEHGNIAAKPQGEGVRRSWLVSIDSLQAFRDARQTTGERPRGYRAPAEGAEIAAESSGEAIRVLAERLEDAAARAAEFRVRLELTEQAQSTLRAELEDAHRRRMEAERERDKLRRELEALRERRESPVSPGPSEPPTEERRDSEEAREATQRAAETLKGPEPSLTTPSTQRTAPSAPQAGQGRGGLWRRLFGR